MFRKTREMSCGFNSTGAIQRLGALKHPGWKTEVYERTAKAPLNWRMYETLKTAIGFGIVHAPWHQLAFEEITALELRNGRVDAPTSGPTQSRDVIDCIANVVCTLLGDQADELFARLSALPLAAAPYPATPGPLTVAPTIPSSHAALSDFGAAYNRVSAARDGRRRNPGRGTPWLQ